jgi:cell division cycle 2-like protein
MAATIATRKRPALDGPCFSAAKKRSHYVFGSIYEYKKLGVLGEGTYGKVVRARHRRTGEMVAIKWVRATRGGGGDGTRAALREAGCLAACRGAPSVVQIRDVAADEASGDLFIVTELVDGPSLRDRLTLTGRFPEAPARAAMRQLLRGVAWVHRAGALHRDVKPENVLVGPGGALKICDFGSATPVRPPYLEDRVGTLWYLAPEMLKGSRCYGPPVDMWVLGCVMLELLTGKPVFPGVQTKEDLLVEVFQLRDKMDSDGVAAFKGLPPDLSKAAGELLCGLLCFDEGKRLTAAQALNHRWFSESEEAESMDPD